jgi:hypothetical protein
LQDRAKDLERQLNLSETKLSDLKSDFENMKRDLFKAEVAETEMRKVLDQLNKTNAELISTKDQV